MNDGHFDSLTRTLSSRRIALAGLLSGVAALLSLSRLERGAAHIAKARCRRLHAPARRRACLRRASAHNRQHQCRVTPIEEVCAGRCGSATNNCGQRVACYLCPAGLTCLSSGSCAQSCQSGIGSCPTGCRCNRPEVGKDHRYCIPNSVTECPHIPMVCVSTTQCPLNHFCMVTGCGRDLAEEGRCTPVCQA